MSMPTVLLIGDVARRLGVQPWHIRRAIQRGYLSEPLRVGGFFRAFGEEDLPRVESALRAAGYLPERAEVGHAG